MRIDNHKRIYRSQEQHAVGSTNRARHIRIQRHQCWSCLAIVMLLIIGPAKKAYAQQPAPTHHNAPAIGQNSAGSLTKQELKQRYPQSANKLHGQLLHLMDRHMRLGKQETASFAAANLINVSDDCVTTIVVPAEGVDPQTIAPLLTQYGANVIRTGQRHVKANIPIGQLQAVTQNVQQIGHIRLPNRPKLDVISEGVAHMNADNWQSCGYTGTGTKIAIVDGGFIGLSAAQSAGELPAGLITRDETGTGIEAGTPHGVAVAEIVHEIAPDAQLYLVKVGDESDLESAKNYCISNGIDIVNHSMGWYGTNFFDGAVYSSATPSPVDITNDAEANGILWINSAGNDGRRNWRGDWIDVDGDKWIEWTTDVEVNEIGYVSAGATVVLWLTWNDWPTTRQDYDLYLMRWTGSEWATEAASTYMQNGFQAPIEVIGVYVSESTYYAAAIRKSTANKDKTFILRCWYQNLNLRMMDGSIGCPADAASAMAVGAIDEDLYMTGPTEMYSSRGPNNGSYTGNPILTKPDVCGPDATASWTYTGGFYGTSASSPHVAGIAGLVHSRFPSYTNAQIRAYIESSTLDLGSAGMDNTYGYGSVVLPAFECCDDTDCNDSNVCTDDACVDNICEYTNNTNACDDGLFCTATDVCADGTCTGSGDTCPGQVCNEDLDVCVDLPRVNSASSVKNHGSAGDFSINVLDRTDNQDIECRQYGVTKLVVGFDLDIQGVGGLDPSDVSLSSGTVTTVNLSASNELTIEMSSTTNAVPLTVNFPGIATAGDPGAICTDSVCIRPFVGDVLTNVVIDVFDRLSVRNHMGIPVDMTNFRNDVRADGDVNVFDRLDVRNAMITSFIGSCP